MRWTAMSKTIAEIRQLKAEMDKRIADFITEEVKNFERESDVKVTSVFSGFHNVCHTEEGFDYVKTACVKSEIDFGL